MRSDGNLSGAVMIGPHLTHENHEENFRGDITFPNTIILERVS